MIAEATGPAISTEEFSSTFRNHAAGVAVLTAAADGCHVMMTVSSLFSISSEPPLIGFSLSDLASSSAVFNNAQNVVIHLVDAGSLWLAKLGAKKGASRFEDPTQWRTLPTGERYFPGSSPILYAAITDRFRAGKSTLYVVEALHLIHTDLSDNGTQPGPVVYHNRTWHVLNDSSAVGNSATKV